MKVLAVIPARYGSVRFPGKALAVILNKPMVQWVYEAASRARLVDEVIVATDDERIVGVVKDFGGRAQMTSPKHHNGTERIAEVAESTDADVIVNVQGDEPAVDPRSIDQVINPLRKFPNLRMTTLKIAITNPGDAANPNVVKVVTDGAKHALYFSRHAIPFAREGQDVLRYKHLGIYGYRRDFLLQYVRLDPSPLEQAECLEQLRALDHGVPIRVIETQWDSVGVDSPTDLECARELLERKAKKGESG